MAATVVVNEWHGTTATPTQTDKTSGTIRFKNADNATVDLNDPLTVPSTGTDWSYEKWTRLEITGGSFSEISNLQAYTDGNSNFGTGITTYYRTTGSFAAPAEETGTTGLTDLFTATSGTPVDLDATNTGPFTATGHIGDFLVMAMSVGTTASQGTLSAETLTYSYDEI